MYKRVLLAYDGSIEGRSALREGALLAKHCEARVFLLSIVAETAGVRLAESVYAGVIAKEGEVYQGILDEGAERLKQLGLSAVAALEFGEPAPTIAGFARRVEADLVVVGHRHRGALERWWTGSTSAHLLDLVECSLLIAKDTSADQGLQAKTPVGRSQTYGRLGVGHILTVNCTRECLALVADTSLSGRRVARELDAIIAQRGRPDMIVSDNGSAYRSKLFVKTLQTAGARPCRWSWG